jgi:pantoate--beta-alanine ligase
MMETISELPRLRTLVAGWRREELRVAFVPTMGNLHAGHFSLLQLAREHADRVVASVFVNPTQFGPGEDFERYPRTPQADAAGLESAGCDALWLPSVDTMYPFGPQATVQVSVPEVTSVLEGAHRPGHFDGVATVVARLFNQVQPDIAVFGQKDYQQLAVIRYLVRDLAFPIRLLAGATLREADGLAMSSRNQYLSAAERPAAAEIHRALLQMREAALAGSGRAGVEQAACARLTAAGFKVDYAALRRPDLSEPVDAEPGPRVALIAARLGRTRLIDNLAFGDGSSASR